MLLIGPSWKSRYRHFLSIKYNTLENVGWSIWSMLDILFWPQYRVIHACILRNPVDTLVYHERISIQNIFWSCNRKRNCSKSGVVGLRRFVWWAQSAKRKDHHEISSGGNSIWLHSNTGLPNTRLEQILVVFGVWTLWLTLWFCQ